MSEHAALYLDRVQDYIEEALRDQTLSDAEREVVLSLRQVLDSVHTFGDFGADFLRIDPSTFTSIEKTERRLHAREEALHAAAGKLRAMASELRSLAAVLPREQEELYTIARRLHAMADRVEEEWDVLHAEWCALRAQEDTLLPKALVYNVFRELYTALCLHDSRYAQEVDALPADATRLITVVTQYVARRGFASTAATAVTATVLWLIENIGRQRFCNFYAPYFTPASV